MDKQIIEGNAFIKAFYTKDHVRGQFGRVLSAHEYKYFYSYDWIMPVFFKFRDLVITDESLFIQHDYWIKKVVEALKYGDVEDKPSKAFFVLIQAITWYNSTQSNLK